MPVDVTEIPDPVYSFDNLPYPFLMAEVVDGVCYNKVVNSKFLDEIGYPVTEIPTIDDWFEKAYPDLTYRNQVIASWYAIAKESTEQRSAEAIMIAHITTKRFGQRWYEVKASITPHVHTVGFINIDELMGSDKALRARIENKNKTLAILSHDLRGPLSNLLGLSRLALEGRLSGDEFSSVLSKINHRTEQTLQFLETTLVWTRSNFGEITVRNEIVSLSDVATIACNAVEDIVEDKRVTIVTEGIEDAQLMTDPEILLIILRNILSNAVKFSPTGGKVLLSFRGGIHAGILEIQDEGPGISDEVVEGVLQGRRLDHSSIEAGKGAGIGLRFCVELAHRVSAKISFQAIQPKGTIVRIQFVGSPTPTNQASVAAQPV